MCDRGDPASVPSHGPEVTSWSIHHSRSFGGESAWSNYRLIRNLCRFLLIIAKIYLTLYTVYRTVFNVQCTRYSMAPIEDSRFENLRLELRRGCLTLAVLGQLQQEHYGYTLRKALAGRGLEIEESTLYPLLRRLESQGLLVSEWREEDKRNKRFYRLSGDGEQMLGQLLQEWQAINTSIDRILKEVKV